MANGLIQLALVQQDVSIVVVQHRRLWRVAQEEQVLFGRRVKFATFPQQMGKKVQVLEARFHKLALVTIGNGRSLQRTAEFLDGRFRVLFFQVKLHQGLTCRNGRRIHGCKTLQFVDGLEGASKGFKSFRKKNMLNDPERNDANPLPEFSQSLLAIVPGKVVNREVASNQRIVGLQPDSFRKFAFDHFEIACLKISGREPAVIAGQVRVNLYMAGSLGVHPGWLLGRGCRTGSLFVAANIGYPGNLQGCFANFQSLPV